MIAASSWFLVTLIGLGFGVSWLFFRRAEIPSLLSSENLVHTTTLFLMLGLLADHGIGVLSGSLHVQHVFAWAGLLDFGVLIAFMIYTLRRRPVRRERDHKARLQSGVIVLMRVVAVLLIMLLAAVIFSRSLFDWDARSVWFFHGKVIFFDGGLHPSEFWRATIYNFSHKDYPKLLPMLSARVADFVVGDWNEFAPKGALVPLLCSGLLGLWAITRNAPAYLLLLVATIAVIGDQLWNGYMDGWVAIHGCVVIGALVQWFRTGDRQSLCLALAALGVCLCLKNEGVIVAVVAVPVLLCGVIRHRRLLIWRDLTAVGALVPFVLWLWLRPHLFPFVDTEMESAGIAQRALTVIMDGPALMARLTFLVQAAANTSFLLECAAATVIVGLCAGLFRSSTLFIATAGLYSLILLIVYLGTPYAFEWHVNSSLPRVVLFPTLLFLTGLCDLLPSLLPTAFLSDQRVLQRA